MVYGYHLFVLSIGVVYFGHHWYLFIMLRHFRVIVILNLVLLLVIVFS